MLGLRHMLAAAALVATAVSSGATADTGGRTVVVDGVTYHVVAEGSVPVSRSALMVGRPVGGGPGRSATCVPEGYAEVLGRITWVAAINPATDELVYVWRGAGQAGILSGASCVSGPVSMMSYLADRPVVGTGTAAAGETRFASGPAPVYDDRATVSAVYYDATVPYATAGLPVRSQVLGSVSMHVWGFFVDRDGNWYDYCNTVTLYFKPSPVGPTDFEQPPVNPQDRPTC